MSLLRARVLNVTATNETRFAKKDGDRRTSDLNTLVMRIPMMTPMLRETHVGSRLNGLLLFGCMLPVVVSVLNVLQARTTRTIPHT